MIFELENFDQFVLLLSSDWGEPFLQCDLELTHDEMRNVKLASRSAVEHLMSTALEPKTFYNADMSIERRKRTWNILSSHLLSKKTLERVQLFIENDLNQKHFDDITLSALWLILDDYFVSRASSDINQINSQKLIQLKSVFIQLESGDDDIEQIAIDSNSKWDNYLTSLTPEIPTALSDFYEIKVNINSKFKRFWVNVMKILDKEEESLLLSWLAREYESLTGNRFGVPDWLVQTR